MSALDKYYRFSKVAGVSIVIGANSKAVANLCFLSIEGNNLSITKIKTGIEDFKNLKDLLADEKIPIALNISGKGILTKQVIRQPNESLELASILPNVDVKDFYIQEFSSGDNTFVSVVRKTEAQKWLNQFDGLGLKVVCLSLGVFVMDQVLPLLNVYGNEVIFDGNHINLNDRREWLNAKFQTDLKAQFPFKIESEKIEEEAILPYSAAFQLALYPGVELIRAKAETIGSDLTILVETHKLKVQGASVLIVAFLLLLVNFICFSYLNAANAKLATQLGQTEADAGQAQQYQDSVKIKKALLDSLGWEGKTRKSVLIDQLAQLLPAEVKWQQIVVDPLIIASSGDKQHFATRQINVTGISERITSVNEWLARVKTKSWIKKAELKNYVFNNEQNTGQFAIIIDY